MNSGGDDSAGLEINRTIVKPGENFRQGVVGDMGRRGAVVIWVKLNSTLLVKFSICVGKVKKIGKIVRLGYVGNFPLGLGLKIGEIF